MMLFRYVHKIVQDELYSYYNGANEVRSNTLVSSTQA